MATLSSSSLLSSSPLHTSRFSSTSQLSRINFISFSTPRTTLSSSTISVKQTRHRSSFQVKFVASSPTETVSKFDEMVSGTKRKYYMLGGKGGVGKTSCAAFLAVRFANNGHPTLVVSTDPAHSLSDSFAQDLTGGMLGPVEGPESPLFALEVEPEWRQVQDLLRRFVVRVVCESVVSEFKELVEPGLEPNNGLTWEMTKRRGDRDVHKETKEKPGWCSDPHLPPCAAFVEIMAPVFSREAWRCVWHMIQGEAEKGKSPWQGVRERCRCKREELWVPQNYSDETFMIRCKRFLGVSFYHNPIYTLQL